MAILDGEAESSHPSVREIAFSTKAATMDVGARANGPQESAGRHVDGPRQALTSSMARGWQAFGEASLLPAELSRRSSVARWWPAALTAGGERSKEARLRNCRCEVCRSAATSGLSSRQPTEHGLCVGSCSLWVSPLVPLVRFSRASPPVRFTAQRQCARPLCSSALVFAAASQGCLESGRRRPNCSAMLPDRHASAQGLLAVGRLANMLPRPSQDLSRSCRTRVFLLPLLASAADADADAAEPSPPVAAPAKTMTRSVLSSLL